MAAPEDNRAGVCKTPNCTNATVDTYRTCAPCRRWRIRLLTIDRYGGECVCCSITEPGFLTLDHIDGGGRAHRSSIFANGKGDLWVWAWRNDCPPILRLMCFNCNSGRARNGGICPHIQPYRPPGEIVGLRRVSDADRAGMRSRFAAGASGPMLAREYGVSKQTVYNIAREESRASA